eukprot:scaffold6750_cov160-Amphora_coffeaeformis.AAC.12
MSIPIFDGVESHLFYSIKLPADIINDNLDLIETGKLFISTNEFSIDDDTIVIDSSAITRALEKSPLARRQLQNGVDIRVVAVLRVSASDGPPKTREVEYSKKEIEKHMFENEVGLKHQIENCSNGAIKIVPAGVFEVTVPGVTSDFSSPAEIRNVALELLAKQLNVDSASNLFDHVVVILPPNDFSGFVGNAGVNHWVSTLNNVWSLDVMVYMHEIGHNLGLSHAVLTDNSADYSSYMSATGWAPNLDGPLKCFNAASNKLLGWYDTRKEQIHLSTSNPVQMVRLAAFSEADLTDYPILLEVGEYALQYNYASRFNSGTEILRNKVTVAHSIPGKTIVEKEGLSPNGHVFTVENFEESGQVLRIEACEQIYGNSKTANAMTVGVTLGKSGSPCTFTANLPISEPRVNADMCHDLDKKKCRRSPNCIYSKGTCGVPTEICPSLGKKRCERIPVCNLIGDSCVSLGEKPLPITLINKPVPTNFNTCTGLDNRRCKRRSGCRISEGTCVVDDIFVW